MVNIKNTIIIGLACIAGIIAFFWFYQTDEAKIKKRFTVISEQAAKESDETELTAALKAKQLSDMFTSSCRIIIPSESVSATLPKSDISAHIMAARLRYSKIILRFYDIKIEFPKETVADVSLTASLTAKTTSGEPVDEIHELKCVMDKIEKDWFFSGVEEVDVLEK